MERDRHRMRRHWRVPITLTIMASLLTLALGSGSGVVDAVPQSPGALDATAQSTAPAWDPQALYNEGDVVSHNGRLWRANHFMWPGVEPGVDGVPPWWVPWDDLGPIDDEQDPGESVEVFFAVAGPWAVSSQTVSTSGPAGSVTVFHPTDLGADGVEHPILTWGQNPTFAQTGDYVDLLGHLASWGFVVVSTNTTQTGAQHVAAIVDAAEWMVDQDDDPGSVFFDTLATDNVGAIGHSAGADGVIQATVQSDGLITSTLPISLPDVVWQDGSPVAGMLGQLEDPVFYMYGNDDFLTIGDQELFFNSTGGAAVTAALVGADHFFPANEGPICISILCGNGNPSAMWGYATAWFKYTLEGDGFARGAFVAEDGGPGELFADGNWVRTNAKGLS